MTLPDSKVTVVTTAKPRRKEQEQMTKSFDRYVVDPYPIVVFDCWGWKEGTNYKHGEFLKMIEGELQVGHKMSTEKFSSVSNKRNAVDAVVVVIDAKRAINEEDQFFEDLRPFVEYARRRNIVVVFAITKVDMLDALVGKLRTMEVKQARKAMENDKEYREIRKRIKDKFEDDEVRVFPVVNYEAEDTTKDELMSGSVETILNYITTSIREKSGDDVNANIGWKRYDLFDGEQVIEFKYKSK